MSSNIIREDVVSVGFDIDLKELNDLQKELNDIKKKLLGGIGDDAFDGLGDSADDAKEDIDKLTQENKKLRDELEKVKGKADQVKNKLIDLGKKGATAAFNGLKKLAGISFKALTIGIAGAATATGLLVKNAVQAYADYEQLVGGVDTLFKKNSSTVQKFANDAYRTAGLSANAYMETVTSFSAAMINSVGGDTALAAKLSDMAITDMSDNANKMGTSMDSIIQTYQSLARGNYMMLDNLKLGYGGTKEELKRLMKDAQKLTGKKYDISNFSDIVEAIHAVQDKMGITGTTAKEASTTITGSLNSMKASWQNLMPALIQGGDAFDQCVDNLVDSAKTFFKNIKPAIIKALSGVGELIEELAPIIEKEFPALVDELLPPLISAATSLLKGLIKALPTIVKTIIGEIPDILKGVGQAISEAFGVNLGFLNNFGDFFDKNGEKIAKFTPILLGLVGAFMLFNKLKGVGSIFSGLFGKKGGKGGEGGGFGGFFDSLAKLKPTSILKGMGNLAIIMGGFALIGGAMALIAPILAEITDLKSLVEAFGVLTLVAIEGVVMTKAVEPLAKMKTTTVLKGIGNLAIIIGGFTLLGAALLLVAPFITQLGDMKSLLMLVGVIGVLGLVGAGLTYLAGIVGNIPVATVALGLANMAIIIAGMSALLLLVGAVSLINFDYKRLTTLIGIIGLLGLVGGALTIFAGIVGMIPIPVVLAGLANIALVMGGMTALILAFGALSKVEGIQEFITAGGDLLAQLFGVIGKIAGSLIGGIGEAISKSLPVIGENLAKFGTNIKPLFSAFKGVDMGGVGSFFSSLGGFLLQVTGNNLLDSLTSWFTGGNSFEQIGKDLTALANGAEGFFTKVATFPENSFTNATSLFECLAGMGDLPNSGGLKGWASGDVDYKAIAKGLESLSGEGVKKFFTMAGGLNSQTFENVKLMFDSLGGLGDMPKKVDKSIGDIVSKVAKLPKKMGDALKNGGKPLADSFVEVWTEAIKASVAPVNKLLSGANHILKEFGAKKRVIEWQPYASGTDGHRGGNALVNDGRGAELVQMPNGNTFIPRGRNVFIPNAPIGMKVLPAESTAQLMGRNAPTFHYADGIGNIDIWSFYDNAKGLVEELTKNISYEGMNDFTSSIGKGMVSTFASEMPAWVDKLFEQCGQGISSYVASKGVTQWLPTVVRALKMEGQYSLGNVARTLFQMKTESGGNPRAINLWDSNAKKGIPSKGLMQVIDPTFNAYARSGFDKDIYDPLSNILASVRYATSRYGSLSKAYRGVGYSKGVGKVSLPSQSLNLSYTPESDSEYWSNTTVENNTYAPVFEAHFHGVTDERSLQRKVKRWFAESFEEMVDEMDRNNPQAVQV